MWALFGLWLEQSKQTKIKESVIYLNTDKLFDNIRKLLLIWGGVQWWCLFHFLKSLYFLESHIEIFTCEK